MLAQALAEGFCIRPGRVADIAKPGDLNAWLRLGDEWHYEKAEGEETMSPTVWSRMGNPP
jgi:hypothetical protein